MSSANFFDNVESYIAYASIGAFLVIILYGIVSSWNDNREQREDKLKD